MGFWTIYWSTLVPPCPVFDEIEGPFLSFLVIYIDDVYFQSELGWSVKGVLDWTKIVGGQN